VDRTYPMIFYPDRPIITVSLAANTTALVLTHLTLWAPWSNLAARVNGAINDRPAHTAGHRLLSVVQVATNTDRL